MRIGQISFRLAGSDGVSLETAKLTGSQLNLPEKQTLDAILRVYEDWKKEILSE